MVTGKNVNGVMIENAIHIHDLPFTNEKEEHRGAPQFITTISAGHAPFCDRGQKSSFAKLPYLPGRRRGRIGRRRGRIGRRRGRCLDINVNLLRPAAAKQSSSENKSQSQKHEHEDHQYCDHSRTAATTIFIISHETPPPVL